MEQPTLFYAIAIVLALQGGGDVWINVWLAWGYVGFRVLHSLIQATTNVVRWRFLVFTLASICLIGLIVHAGGASRCTASDPRISSLPARHFVAGAQISTTSRRPSTRRKSAAPPKRYLLLPRRTGAPPSRTVSLPRLREKKDEVREVLFRARQRVALTLAAASGRIVGHAAAGGGTRRRRPAGRADRRPCRPCPSAAERRADAAQPSSSPTRPTWMPASSSGGRSWRRRAMSRSWSAFRSSAPTSIAPTR